MMNGIGDELHHQNGHKTPQPSANTSQPPPSTPTTASSAHPTKNGHQNGGNVRHPQQQPSPFQNAATLSLLQQSPLKQLFGTTKPQQLPQPPPYFPGSIANGTAATKYATTATREANGGNGLIQDVSQEAALALLLQSVQTSLLMEQQQKATQQHQAGGTNANLLAQLASLNGLHPQQPNAQTLAAVAALNGNGSNGIERLLTAAALFPQLQPKTPVKQAQEPVTVANIRKNMEES